MAHICNTHFKSPAGRRHVLALTPQVQLRVLILHTVVLVFVLVLQVCCAVKYGVVMLVVIMSLKDTATFQVLFIVSLFCAWNITTVEINSSVYLLKSKILQVPLFTSMVLVLVLVLVLLF